MSAPTCPACGDPATHPIARPPTRLCASCWALWIRQQREGLVYAPPLRRD
jgi:hypothetical protein